MAEDDDDETFGEFTFASSSSAYPLSNTQFNFPESVADADDDEWGDFVKSPQQSKPPSDNGNHHLSGTSVSAFQWTKPRGALPLSIFGGDDDDDNDIASSAGDFNQQRGNGTAAVLSSSTFINNHDVSTSKSLGSIPYLYDGNLQVRHENEYGSKSTVRVDSNGFYSSSILNAARSSLENVNVGTSDHSQVTSKSDNQEFSFKSNMFDPSWNVDLLSGWSLESNGSSSNLNSTTPSVPKSGSNLDMNGHKQELDGAATAIDDDDDDDGDDGWEFKDAYSGFKTGQVNNNVDSLAHEVSERSDYKSLDLFGNSNGSIDFFGMSTESHDFAPSSGIASTFQEVDLIGIQSTTEALSGSTTYSNSNIKQDDIKGTSPSLDVGGTEFDEEFGDFTAASAETGLKTETEDIKLSYNNGALPLSIFGYEEPVSGGSSDVQDAFMHQSTSAKRNSHTSTGVISVNDLISSLYSQAEQTSTIKTDEIPTEHQLSFTNLASDANYLHSSSLYFKDASETTVDTTTSLYNTGDTYLNVSSELKLNNYVHFYSKLKEELCFVAKCHIERLKQSQGNDALSGEGAGAASLDIDYQLVCKELEQMNVPFEKSNLQYHPSGDSYLKELTEVLQQPQFQILESEYHLSQKLLQVEKDLRSAMELIRHTTTMLRILTIGSLEEQTTYISIWSEMLSACAQELKHGASIWNQAVEKHVQSQLVSEPQGRKFVLALGEIYRVVVVLGASAKLFKPWTLSGLVKSPAIYLHLEECHAVWSTSGLEAALSSVSAETALDSTSLIKSIEYILGLDALVLQNYVFAERGSLCRLSMLTEKVVPGMKMIMWGEDRCFLTLANLWANLISCNPPQLPELNFV